MRAISLDLSKVLDCTELIIAKTTVYVMPNKKCQRKVFYCFTLLIESNVYREIIPIASSDKLCRVHLRSIFFDPFSLTCPGMICFSYPICVGLTHFVPLVSFYTPSKHQKTTGFLMFRGGIERDHWHSLTGDRKRSVVWNGLMSIYKLAFDSIFWKQV